MEHILNEFKKKLTEEPELYEYELLTPQKLVKLSSDYKISGLNELDIKQYWRSGLLRADIITSKKPINKPNIELVKTPENGEYRYIDNRKLRRRKNGFGGSCTRKNNLRKDIKLYFHPFKFFIIYKISNHFKSRTMFGQFLLNPKGLLKLSKMELEGFNKLTSTKEFTNNFNKWNNYSELSIILDPHSYKTIFNRTSWKYPDDENSITRKRKKYSDCISKLFSLIDLKTISEIRDHFCVIAELLDQNKLIHILIRLTTFDERKKIKGSLGASLHILTMSEIIRRAYEQEKGIQLPEEDELGFGKWMDGARKMLFGTERILDADNATAKDFLNTMGLDFGLKIRCYVEGSTEYGAFNYALQGFSGIELINLKGQFLEGKGKGLNFYDALKNDKKNKVFSVVVLDGDNENNIKAIKQAIKHNVFFGRFFISSPDFEFDNFTHSELSEIILSLHKKEDFISTDSVATPNLTEILNVVKTTTTAKDFFALLHKQFPSFNNYNKGEKWGEALIDWAIQNRKAINDSAEKNIIEIPNFLLRLKNCGYQNTISKYTVDSETGELIEK